MVSKLSSVNENVTNFSRREKQIHQMKTRAKKTIWCRKLGQIMSKIQWSESRFKRISRRRKLCWSWTIQSLRLTHSLNLYLLVSQSLHKKATPRISNKSIRFPPPSRINPSKSWHIKLDKILNRQKQTRRRKKTDQKSSISARMISSIRKISTGDSSRTIPLPCSIGRQCIVWKMMRSQRISKILPYVGRRKINWLLWRNHNSIQHQNLAW